MTIYIDIVMSILETISMMSKRGYTDKELLEYFDKHMTRLNVNLLGKSTKSPKSAIVIFVWAVN